METVRTTPSIGAHIEYNVGELTEFFGKNKAALMFKNYWGALIKSGRMKKRFYEVENPDMNTAIGYMREDYVDMHFVIDLNKREIIAEFTLENMGREIAVCHYSFHPCVAYKDVIALMKIYSNFVLKSWGKDVRIPYVRPRISTLIGLVEKSNRLSIITAVKSGFKKLDVIPHAPYNEKTGTYTESVMVVKTINSFPSEG